MLRFYVRLLDAAELLKMREAMGGRTDIWKLCRKRALRFAPLCPARSVSAATIPVICRGAERRVRELRVICRPASSFRTIRLAGIPAQIAEAERMTKDWLARHPSSE